MRRAVNLAGLLALFLAAPFLAVADPAARADLFEDAELRGGFNLSAVDASRKPVEIGQIMAQDPDMPPGWRLAQWGTRFCLDDAPELARQDGVRVRENEGKTVRVFPGGLSGDGVWLEVRGGNEYDGRLRQYGESWPHLLVEQRLPGIRPGNFDALLFHVEFRVEKCDATVPAGLDPALHTAHVNAFFTVHNGNPDSPDHNDMIWFGMPLYDVRHDIPAGHQALDVGQANATNKFICSIDGAKLFRDPLVIGKWHTLSCDMTPLLREALAASQERGFLKDTQFSDLTLTSFNLGWEVPGPYDCAVHLRRLGLQGTAVQGGQK